MVGSRPLLFALCMLIPALSGCALDNSTAGQFGTYGDGHQVAISGNGQMTGEKTKTLDCDRDRAQIAVGINGEGEINVRVTDGAGKTVYTESFEGQGQVGETVERSGTPGEWTLKVDFGTLSYTGFGGFQGQYGIYLRC